MGGEPTIHFDYIKKIVKYFNNLHPNVSYIMITNGTFSSAQLKWIVENNIILCISFDGPTQIMQKNRPTYSGKSINSILEKRIKETLKYYPNLSIQTTITDFSLRKQSEIVYYFHTLGLKNIAMSQVQSSGRNLISKGLDFKVFIMNI